MLPSAARLLYAAGLLRYAPQSICTMADRTIIDILRKGNQELFHSSLIAWLLDPAGEHGYGRGLLEAFADVVAEQGHSQLRTALQSASSIKVETETSSGKSRYDIVLQIENTDVGHTKVVIENKTKSLGDKGQFEQYAKHQRDNLLLVALGLCDISFSEEVKAKYPLVTYRDVLDILRIPERPSDFRVLVDHYRRFLGRELGVLSEIEQWYRMGEPNHASSILKYFNCNENESYTKNDKRFLNLGLETNPPGFFSYKDAISAACAQQTAKLWFQIELRPGVFAENNDATAGTIQLRCNAKNNASTFLEAVRPLRAGDSSPKKLKKQSGSFYVLARELKMRHLVASEFKTQLENFAESVGEFLSSSLSSANEFTEGQ